MNSKVKVLVGMSGGVDSAASAALLVEQGYEVIGAFMKNWSGTVEGPSSSTKDKVGSEFEECNWKDERRDAARVAAKLGIPFMTLDFEKEYRRDVVDYMFEEFEKGRTPNPDVMCNKYVKFDLFVKEAERLGCDYVATGHYARIEDGKILKGRDSNKDQTYFLWAIDPKVLPKVLFPIGDMDKPDVRKYAEEKDLIVADKKDSTGICFVGEVDIQKFLMSRIPEEPGNIVTIEGEVLGKHKGINFYTIGQRHGLDVGGGTPYYVVDKKPETKELVVCSNFHPALFRDSLVAEELNWFNKPETPFKCEARIRHRQEVQVCTIESISDDEVQVLFEEPQRAVTSGQSIVFYDKDEMIGGGIIK
jgi:tRNA-uridine 2-sulfurtransferase